MPTPPPNPAYYSKTGFVKDPVDERDFKFAPGAIALPSSVDFSKSYPPCLNQEQCNACTSNATANALRFVTQNGPKVAQSRLFIYWNARVNVAGWSASADTGLTIRDAMKAVAKYNSIPETVWPYDPVPARVFVQPSQEAVDVANSSIETFSYMSVPQTEQDIKGALATGHPIVLGILLLDSFENPGPDATGYVKMTGNQLGWHAVAMVGYDDSTRRFKFQNSWGAGFGVDGFFELDYDWILSPQTASDLWLLMSFTDRSAPPAPTPKPPRKPFYGLTAFAIQNASTKRFLCADATGAIRTLNARQVWVLAPLPDSATTYTLRHFNQKTHPGLLSVDASTYEVDTAPEDDGSGKQHFEVRPTADGTSFAITVPRGLADETRRCVTDAGASGVVVDKEASGDAAQAWLIVPA